MLYCGDEMALDRVEVDRVARRHRVMLKQRLGEILTSHRLWKIQIFISGQVSVRTNRNEFIV